MTITELAFLTFGLQTEHRNDERDLPTTLHKRTQNGKFYRITEVSAPPSFLS